jgi:hypothetical protein
MGILTHKRRRLSSAIAALVLTGVAASCGSTNESTFKPCDDQLKGKCGASCSGDGECPSGLYCGPSSTCTADCTQSSQCPSGQACSSRGRCQNTIITPPDGSAGSSNTDASRPDSCVDVKLKLAKTIPTVVLLLDQSGSMNQAFGPGGDRWTVLRKVLMDPTTGIVKRLENEVRFGLALYTSHNGYQNGATCPILTEVSIAISNYAAINAVYAPAKYDDDTPTGQSIDAVVKKLVPYAEPGPKIIVLATDGEPDTCEQADPQSDLAKTVSITAAQDAFKKGIKTYVIAIGNEVGAQHLQDMANAGVGQPPLTGTAKAYPALDQNALVAAFNEIINGQRSCKLKLNATVEAADAPKGTVTLDGKVLGLNDPNGWRLSTATEIEILGTACTTIKSGDHDLSVTFPCGVVEPIPE